MGAECRTRWCEPSARAFAFALALLSSACGSSDGAGADAGGGGGRAGANGDAGSGGSGDSSGSSGQGAALVGRFWGHLPDNQGGVVLEVVGGASGGMLAARIWKAGMPRETRISGEGTRFSFSGEELAECPLLTLDATGERLELSECGANRTGTLVLRRSHALRIFTAPVKGRALGFDASGTRFAFADGAHFMAWDATAQKLSDLGEGTAGLEAAPGVPQGATGVPPVSVSFAPDGRQLAYLRGGSPTSCQVADLIVFHTDGGTAQTVGSNVPCRFGFAEFSADSAHLAFLANDDGTHATTDLMHWSVGAATADVVATAIDTRNTRPYLVFGSSGERLLFRATNLFAVREPLASFDFATKVVTTLSDSADSVIASPDRAFVAFSNAKGEVILWDDAAAGSRYMEPKPDLPPANTYVSGLSVSADSRYFAYVTSSGDGSVYDTRGTNGAGLGTAGIYCYPDREEYRSHAAFFAPDGSGVVYWPAPMRALSDCSGSAPSTQFGWQTLGARNNAGGALIKQFYAFGPHGEVALADADQVGLWTHESGVTHVIDSMAEGGLLQGFLADFARDGKELVFALSAGSSLPSLWAWDTATASATELTPSLSAGPFRYRVDPISGQVVFSRDAMPPSVELWTPGDAAPVTLFEAADAEVLSDSGRALAVHGTRGTDQGIFTLRLDSRQPTLIEEGTVLGISGTHVYYQAPDGVCVIAY